MKSLTLRVHSASDPGRKRSRNEDSHAVWAPDDPLERARRGLLVVVADGMGGMHGGEVASRLASEAVVRVYSGLPGDDILADLRCAVETANRLVHAEGQRRIELSGMGTTCTAAAVRGEHVWLAHVGDSRAYLIRDAQIHPLTQDHSLVAALVQRHELTAEQARTDSRRNVVTRSIGMREDVDVDAGEISSPLQSGDTLLLCSDGLHGQLTDQEIAALAQGDDLERCCTELIALANQRGGPDNVTVILARAESDDGIRDSQPPRAGARSVPPAASRPASAGARVSAPMILLLIALVLALAALVLSFYRLESGQ